MNVDELIARAWLAVQNAAIPETLHEVAFKEAVDFLRTEKRDPRPRTNLAGKQSPREKTKTSHGETAGSQPDPDRFYSQLSQESGVPETDLRDVLNLTAEGAVVVGPPTKNLGGSRSEQARTVVALVATAHGIGLNENPVSADAVRKETERKRCYDVNNFAAKVLGPLKGFNAGATRNEIVLTSKWVGEFVAAVNQAHGHGQTNDQA